MSTDSQPVHLLMVDDEHEFLTATGKALRQRGISVTTAVDSTTALRAAEAEEFDVVLLDMKMPHMDGMELYRRLRSRHPSLPVLILTGHGTMEDAHACGREGVFAYLAKPCDIDDLAARIRAAATAERCAGDTGLSLTEKIRVLIIDDEVELLQSLRRILERRGIQVHTASSGAQGLALLRTLFVDLVVLDVKMPGLDGIEVLRQIKQDNPTIEVLLLTGHPTVKAAFEGMRHGASDYLVKPPDVAQLVEKIRKAYAHRMETVEQLQRDAMRSIWPEYHD